MAPMIKVITGTSFRWMPTAQTAFDEIKDKLTRAPMLACLVLRRSLKLSAKHLVLASKNEGV